MTGNSGNMRYSEPSDKILPFPLQSCPINNCKIWTWRKGVKTYCIGYTHRSWGGRLRVTLPWESSPYFRYPYQPMAVYKQHIITMPRFKMPANPRKATGVLIRFSIGITYNARYFIVLHIRYLLHPLLMIWIYLSFTLLFLIHLS